VRLLYIIIAMIFTSCMKYSGREVLYTIAKSKHKSHNDISRVKSNRLDFTFTFKDNHRYLNEIPNDVNRLDYNKLYGLTSSNIHDNSIRLAWRDVGDKFELAAYGYLNGERIIKSIGFADIGPVLDVSIIVGDNYSIIVNGRLTTMPGKMFKSYRTFPYFGGDNTAPHTMWFIIIDKIQS